ncbi:MULTISPECIES: SAM hydrolase/SAM-dependent halogenase family protein [Salimicrobium]|uniref:DNA-directed RNA polymerase subunit delta n=2 Tax=Salimicrobium TaxID=351195 RepID=K2FJ56_9BACI|nr:MULTISPECIES: S-adenosyl-l-methionine hydroxide adenosyltransferase family protein [Salimicrobium]AKG05444.1 DNA-directed RNA polymerase subunit delta [Salimicrobium jeotgali]EKE31091.1 hypothetical protein MJ3_10356 [Salimicrobium jeotgali]MBM7697350.1 S-adenosylmethionine hydrolase [Salimicrobium jeotgali]SDY20404.1 hypothetical protein SAMN04488081_2331 [Salimicrobium album]
MKSALVFQSDFGISDGAVSAMYGVAHSVDEQLQLFTLTHEIPAFHIWEASYRLWQTAGYWKKGTVFVSVVDPGVGSKRKSVVAKTADGHYIVTPDNGTLTHIHEAETIVELREIDEQTNRLPNSGESYTFHGRDIYAYTGARLSSGTITYEDVGPLLPADSFISLPLHYPEADGEKIEGTVDILDIQFGNLWTNVPREAFHQLGITHGDSVEVTIEHGRRQHFHQLMTFGHSFADTHKGEPLVYINSLDRLAVAINQGSFAKAYDVGTGPDWHILFRKL